MRPLRRRATFLFLSVSALFLPLSWAQDNYEIQVYPAETMVRRATMVELHSNFTFQGSKESAGGVRPTNHTLHETIEITRGFSDWFETGFYVFTSADSRYGFQWVGDHLRPRVRVPASWHWPVGASLSTEIGYQRAAYSADTWTWEIRPILDKELGRVYLAFNPTFERSLHGPGVRRGLEVSPNFKIGYGISRRLNAGLEYYGALGPVTGFDRLREQGQQLLPCIDLDLGPNWEFNFGVGVGLTPSTDHLLVKLILGRRFGLPRLRRP